MKVHQFIQRIALPVSNKLLVVNRRYCVFISILDWTGLDPRRRYDIIRNLSIGSKVNSGNIVHANHTHDNSNKQLHNKHTQVFLAVGFIDMEVVKSVAHSMYCH